jgi:protein-S-isoprenylcysteine O-methyltransferase Ste14
MKFAKLRFKKIRLWIAWPYFIFFSIFAITKDLYFRQALVFFALGLLIRFWASGYLEKSRRLTTSGPYAFIRNPLYLGNFLLGAGFSVLSQNIYLILYFVLGFGFVYYYTIKQEEQNLSEKFTQDFKEYKKCVPAYFPRLTPYPARDKKIFRFSLSVKNGELIRIFGFLILIAALFLRQKLLLEKEVISLMHLVLISFIFVSIIIILINIGVRRKLDRLEKT